MEEFTADFITSLPFLSQKHKTYEFFMSAKTPATN
jgi:hypothetical protein